MTRSLGRRYGARGWLVGTLALLLASCSPSPDDKKDAAVEFRSALGVIPAERQRPGSPEAGYDALVNNAYVTCGVPYSAYKAAAPDVPPSQLIPGRRGRNAELPYYLTSHKTARGVEVVTLNCLSCHAAYIKDRLIIGLGNESADYTQNPSVSAERVGAYVMGEAETAEWRKWADRLLEIGPYIMTDTVGVNPAVNLTWALLAHRDPKTLAWSPKPLIEPPPTKPLPVSVPPWWRMQKKNAMFYTAAGRGDHARLMVLASTLCTDDLEEARAIDAYAPDIRAFIASMKPPPYPFDIDRKRAEFGRSVFEKTCSGCHGTYGPHPTYPNLVIGVDAVGTDAALAQTAVGGGEDRFFGWLKKSFYGENSRLAPAPGYVAPPLDGIWATAPYLHNGSVPTLAALLNSPTRPRYWLRSFNPADYDTRRVGWIYKELRYGKDGAADSHERKRIYDTTLPGYSNQGHTFGDALNEQERSALIEYLKTL